MYNYAALGPLQYVGVAIGGVVLTAVFLFFLLREQKNIEASDGTLFSSEEACKSYEELLQKINKIYLDTENKTSAELFGIQITFIKILQNDGFKDAKTLIKYKEDFRKLVNLFD